MKVARENMADAIHDGLVSPSEIANAIREQQKAAIEKVLAHIGGVEFHEGNGRSWARGWTVQGEENKVWSDGKLSIDELLDADE